MLDAERAEKAELEKHAEEVGRQLAEIPKLKQSVTTAESSTIDCFLLACFILADEFSPRGAEES